MSKYLDKRNRQILYQLDLNSRQSNSQIAKRIGISKDAVSYRIKNLEQKGYIRGYNTIIDSTRLGYSVYRVYLNLMDTTPSKLNEMIEFLKKEKNVWWIARLDGVWNFIFAVSLKSNKEFIELYKKRFYNQFKQYIKENLICIITTYTQFNRSYLLEEKDNSKTHTSSKFETVESGGEIDHDDIDINILRILSKDARTQLLNIARKLKLDSMTIYHRIKKLEKSGVIQGYKVDINFNLLKRDFYCVKMNVRETTEISKIKSYLKTLPELTAIAEAIGGYDTEFDLEVENSERYFKIIEELEKRFDTIREIKYFRVLKNDKILYMPEE